LETERLRTEERERIRQEEIENHRFQMMTTTMMMTPLVFQLQVRFGHLSLKQALLCLLLQIRSYMGKISLI
jgi:hypothetical protein